MSNIRQELNNIKEQFAAALAAADTTQMIEQLRISYLGKKGALTKVLRGMGALSREERPAVGQLANEVRELIERHLSESKEKIAAAEARRRLESEKIDISLPGTLPPRGGRHPISLTIETISQVFMGLGYRIAEGPEVEFVRYNFDLLRIEEGHPSRDSRDTYYITDDICLRTQTSPVQIRVMEHTRPPIKFICPGKVYRPDTPDATHSPIFHQIEGLVVDRNVAMSDLVGSLKLFARELFGPSTEIRLRPHHFPFTEPSCEVDVTCWKCGGSGCPTCKDEGFVEVLGAGMVHPGVLENCGIDSEVYSGFAFGIGVERTAMARYNIDDIRNLYENNLRFLEQFK